MKLADSFKVLSFNTWILPFYPFLMASIRYWRKKAIGMLSFKPGDKVLIPGVGSGHDLPFIPKDVQIEGVDITDAMLGIAKAKLKIYKREDSVTLRKMDAEQLDYADNSFDKVIMSLFLTVVYDPKKAFAEAVRVVKPGGEILIYDHLLRKGTVPKIIAKPIDAVLSFSFASVTRIFEEIVENQPVELVKVIPGDPVGFVKGFLLKKSS
ncbi:MAG TPA: methyltransferase domain-containing protein [Thermodesulfovibrionia bacterium]|nr:methyltransferase domain-containing protein [Thermodesulfovibrionia bacterium]